MKVVVTFKDPDFAISCPDGEATDCEDQVRERIRHWFQWGEYVDIEIDIDADTARVVKPS